MILFHIIELLTLKEFHGLESAPRMCSRPVFHAAGIRMNKYGVPVSQMIHRPLSCLVSRQTSIILREAVSENFYGHHWYPLDTPHPTPHICMVLYLRCNISVNNEHLNAKDLPMQSDLLQVTCSQVKYSKKHVFLQRRLPWPQPQMTQGPVSSPSLLGAKNALRRRRRKKRRRKRRRTGRESMNRRRKFPSPRLTPGWTC